jgi:ABC-2 type transport system permease protein
MWARNMGNLLMSPLRPLEFVAALMVMSLVRLALGLGPVALLAIPFFGFNVFAIGLPLAVFIANLVLFGWAVALVVSGLILRNGIGAEGLAWTIMFIVLPLGCVYYPVAMLPAWLQPISWALPPTAVFEGLRAILSTGAIRPDLMLWAFALNIVYVSVSIVIFLYLLERSRVAGSLVQMGE